jgi:hypothetical protein
MKPFLIVVAVLFLNCSLMAESPTTRSSDYESATAWYRAIVTGPQAFADFDFNAWVQYVDTESSATVRDVAITNILLCKENHQRAIPIIQRHFQTESAEWLRKSLVDDLCLCGDQQEARDMLVSIFTNNSELKSVRSESLASLAKLKDPHVLAILYAQLSDPDPQNKIFALQNIPHFDSDWDQSGAKVLDFLNSNLSDNDDVVKETIKCLEDCKYKPAVHDMLRIIEDNRDSHKFWSELTAAAGAIQPNVGTDLIKTLKDEDDAIRQARARADAWNAQYASGREQWQRNIEAEKARREQLREDALSKASEQ